MYEIFEKLLQKHGITAYKVSKATGISTATLSDWKNGRSIPKSDKMRLLADYFGVTLEYLTTGNNSKDKIKKSDLALKDENDIAKDLDRIIEKLSFSEDRSINFNGVKMSLEAVNLLNDELQLIQRKLKIINKKQ